MQSLALGLLNYNYCPVHLDRLKVSLEARWGPWLIRVLHIRSMSQIVYLMNIIITSALQHTINHHALTMCSKSKEDQNLFYLNLKRSWTPSEKCLILGRGGISSRETQLGGPLVCRVEHYNLTLIVTRQDRYFCLSPMSMTLLRKGTAALMRSSMGTGAMFSPPDVMMSSTGPYS